MLRRRASRPHTYSAAWPKRAAGHKQEPSSLRLAAPPSQPRVAITTRLGGHAPLGAFMGAYRVPRLSPAGADPRRGPTGLTHHKAAPPSEKCTPRIHHDYLVARAQLTPQAVCQVQTAAKCVQGNLTPAWSGPEARSDLTPHGAPPQEHKTKDGFSCAQVLTKPPK